MMELRRIWGQGKLWLLVLAVLVCNLFLFYTEQNRTYKTEAGFFSMSPQSYFAKYDQMLAEAAALPIDEAVEQCRAQKEQDEAVQEWSAESYLRKNYLLPYLEYLQSYPDYLETVQKNAKQLKEISIFASKNAFSNRNIALTAQDFARMTGTQLKAGNYRAVSALTQYRMGDYLLCILLLALCWQMLAERKKGLWGIVRLASGGRAKLAGKRALIFTGSAVGLFALLYGSALGVSLLYFGNVDWQAPVQSLQEMAKFPYPYTMRRFVMEYLSVKCLGLLLVGLLLWAVMAAFRNAAAAISVAGLAMAGEYALFAFLPVQSALNGLKYCNLFAWFYLDELYTRYLNLNFFGYPFNARRMLFTVLPFLLAVAYGAVITINACKRPEQRRNPFAALYERLCHFSDRAVCCLGGFGMEVYKGLVVQRGGVYLIATAVVVCQLFPVVGGWASQGRTLRERRLEEWEGQSSSSAVVEAMAQEKSELDQAYADYAQLQAAYAEGTIDAEQMEIATVLMLPINTRNAVYEELSQKIQRQEAQGREAWLFNDRWLQELFWGQSTQRQLALITLLAFVLLLTPLFSYEVQSGAQPILRLAGRGRRRFVLRKQGMTLLVVILVGILVYGGHFWSVVRYYPAHGLAAPIQASDLMETSTWNLTVGQFVLLVYGLRVLTLWCVAQMLLLVSSCAKKVQTAALLGIVLLVLPAALATIGLEAAQWISPLQALSTIELLQSAQFQGLKVFWPYLILFGLGLASALLSARRWTQEFNDRI